MTVPVASSVSVSVPNATAASYTFGSPSMYGRSRVACPTSSTSNPVANGSSVPAWPIRRLPVTLRATLTTSCDVMPAGLSTSTIPSIGRPSPSGRAVRRARVTAATLIVVDLREQGLDSRRTCDAVVELERQLRCKSKTERAAYARTQMAGDARESVQRRRALGVAPEDADEHLRMTEVSRDVHAGHGDEPHDTRILHAFREEHRHLFADRFGNAVWATVIVHHD